MRKNNTNHQCDSFDFYAVISDKNGRRGGLVVSALDSGSRGPGSSPGLVICVVFLC